MAKDIFDLITTEESAYQTIPVPVIEDYEWSMPLHIKTTVLYKNSQYLTGKDDNKPFKNIIRPILNLQYRAEGFDVKDIVLFVNDSEKYYMSFLVKKYFEKWARENKLDTFIDGMVENYVDFGGALVKDVNDVKPENVPWQSVAFCDQTDVMGGPLGLKHSYSPDQLLEMASSGWGNAKNGATATLDEVITLASNQKVENSQDKKKIRTPGKQIEVYEIHGMFPEEWLEDGKDDEVSETAAEEKAERKYVRQLWIVTMLKNENDTKMGIVLFRGKENESIFKLILRDEIYGRALGMGGAEELFEPQVWVNYDTIRMKGMLDIASKVIFQTTDPAFANRNKTSDLDNGEILINAPETTLTQINTQPVNIVVFENAVKNWEAHAQQMGAANDSIMGEQPTSGTPFKLQELVTQEAHSLHEYRKGKLAIFLDEVFKDWIIPHIAKEITQDHEFLASLDLDELQTVADNVVTQESNNYAKEIVLRGEDYDPQKVQAYGQQIRNEFMKSSKKFISILEGELKGAPLDVEVNIAGKQKDLSGLTDKLVNVFRQIIQAPGILDDPRMAKIFNQILESSGLSPIDFYQKPAPQQGNQPSPKVAESIAFKDLPPDGQVQMAAQAGIKITPPQQPAIAAAEPQPNQ